MKNKIEQTNVGIEKFCTSKNEREKKRMRGNIFFPSFSSFVVVIPDCMLFYLCGFAINSLILEVIALNGDISHHYL